MSVRTEDVDDEYDIGTAAAGNDFDDVYEKSLDELRAFDLVGSIRVPSECCRLRSRSGMGGNTYAGRIEHC